MQDRLDRGAVFWWPDPALRHRALETIEVVGKPEEAAIEHMHDVVDDIGPRKTPIGDGQRRLGDRDEASPDITGALGEDRVVHASSPRYRKGSSHNKRLRTAIVMPVIGNRTIPHSLQRSEASSEKSGSRLSLVTFTRIVTVSRD